MAKKMILVMVFLVLAGGIPVFSDVSEATIRIKYIKNMSEAAFMNYNGEGFSDEVYYNAWGSPYRRVPVGKISRPVISAIWKALEDYDYEVGDVFLFSCMESEEIIVLVRLSVADGQWTFYYRAKIVTYQGSRAR